MGAAAVAPVAALLAPHLHYTPRLPNLHSSRQFSAISSVSVRASYQDDEFSRDYDEEELGFGSRSQKQRKWWSDDPSTPWWDAEGEDEDDDDEDDEFYGLGAFSSIFKVFQAFGWVVPAIVVSMFLGTGSNAFLMALALPLAQSALSSAFDLIWGRAVSEDSGRQKSRSRRRKRYSSEAYSGSDVQEERERNPQSSNSSGSDYISWVNTGNVSGMQNEAKSRSFGGWDELDDQRRKEKEAKTAVRKEKTWQSQGKLSKGGGRKRRTPLLVRLLVAFFPFLGFWTKLF